MCGHTDLWKPSPGLGSFQIPNKSARAGKSELEEAGWEPGPIPHSFPDTGRLIKSIEQHALCNIRRERALLSAWVGRENRDGQVDAPWKS